MTDRLIPFQSIDMWLVYMNDDGTREAQHWMDLQREGPREGKLIGWIDSLPSAQAAP